MFAVKQVVILLLFFSAIPLAVAQEITFENLDFDVMHNYDISKVDLVEKVVLIHFWGTT